MILPDGGRNYLSKLYNDEWMRANGLLAATGAATRVEELLARPAPRPSRSPTSSSPGRPTASATAIELLQEYGISQMPVSEQPDGDAVEGIVGSINESSLLDRAYRDPEVVERTVGEVMEPPLPMIDGHGDARRGVLALSEGAPALVAVRGGARRASSPSSTCSSSSARRAGVRAMRAIRRRRGGTRVEMGVAVRLEERVDRVPGDDRPERDGDDDDGRLQPALPVISSSFSISAGLNSCPVQSSHSAGMANAGLSTALTAARP